jgi:UDP-N-acetylglucosamine:LPS N-acetylglucosamine transferase
VKILIATAGYGAGHNAAARHLESGIRAEYPQAEVLIVDPLDRTFGRVDVQARKFYLGMINRAPRLWQKIYDWIDRHPGQSVKGPGTLLLARGIQRLVNEHYPDVWVSTYPVYNYFFDKLNIRVPRVTIVTDSISVNRIWTGCRHHPYIVPNEATGRVLVEQGVDPSLVHPLGFPVTPLLDTPAQRPPMRDGLKVLYIINGALDMADELVAFLASQPQIQSTIITGNYAKRLARYQADFGHCPQLTLLGWSKNVPELMQRHHLLISKAGGATVQEAIAAGIPMIVNQVVPGQEAGNWQLLADAGAGVALETAPAIATYLSSLGEPGYHALAAGVASLQKPRAARTIARFIMRLAGDRSADAG